MNSETAPSTEPPPNNESEDHILVPETDESILALVNDPTQVSYIIPGQPQVYPNSSLFLVTLEYTHFTPGLEINNHEFNMRFIHYGQMIFILATIPQKYHQLAEKIADSLNLSLRQGVVPFDGISPWKFGSPFCYMLGMKEGFDVVNDLQERQALLDAEDAKCSEIIEAHDKQFDIVRK